MLEQLRHEAAASGTGVIQVTIEQLNAIHYAQQATIADLQGQLAERKATLGKVCDDLSAAWRREAALQQRVAQLEAIKAPDDSFTYCAFCGEKSPVDEHNEDLSKHISVCKKHPMRDAEKRLTDLQADHARVLGLVQALPVVKDVAIRHSVDEHEYEEWRVWLDGNPFADCDTLETAEALKGLIEYRASLPAQALIDRMAHINDGCECRICKPQPAQGGTGTGLHDSPGHDIPGATCL